MRHIASEEPLKIKNNNKNRSLLMSLNTNLHVHVTRLLRLGKNCRKVGGVASVPFPPTRMERPANTLSRVLKCVLP